MVCRHMKAAAPEIERQQGGPCVTHTRTCTRQSNPDKRGTPEQRARGEGENMRGREEDEGAGEREEDDVGGREEGGGGEGPKREAARESEERARSYMTRTRRVLSASV